MDDVKTWLVEVLVKKMLPSLVKGMIAAGLGILATHQGLLNSIGVTWDGQGHTIDIDLDQLSAWLVVVGSGGVMMLFAAAQHHAGAVIMDKPQSGDMRQNTVVIPAVEGGERSGDK